MKAQRLVVLCGAPFVLLLLVPGCGPSEEEKLLRYNSCVNGYMLEAARKVGVPTDARPTPEEVERVQAEVDLKCGHLK